jgi:Flp pilus assembly pilin Flp
LRFLKCSIAVEHGFLAAGLTVAISAALQSLAVVLHWIA